jgi:3-dehydroquinate synthase class II
MLGAPIMLTGLGSRAIFPRLQFQSRQMSRTRASPPDKIVWIKTTEKDVITTALETGLSDTLLMDADDADVSLPRWRQLGRLNAVLAHPDGTLEDDAGASIGRLELLTCPEDLAAAQAAAAAPSAASETGFIIMDASDWQIIPAENLVAAYQPLPARLIAVARSAAAAETMLGALEIGADGVVLETSDPGEVRKLAQIIENRASEGQERLNYAEAAVTAVRPVAAGDRVCVDLAVNMTPGEGMLVGNFARGAFLVHSECEESGYINSRPFRVNAGPVHAYCCAPGGKTRYLAELKSGDEVEVADAAGRRRRALIGRVKIERRPLVLVEASTAQGQAYSILLQNAETVKLVGPVPGSSSEKGGNGWRAVSVSMLAPGDTVYVLEQGAARHTGISIEESITER